MSNKELKRKYGTHRRISDDNMERIKSVGEMGDSVNKAISKLLDFWEVNHNNCLTLEELEAVCDLARVEDHGGDDENDDYFITLLESASTKLYHIIEERKKKERTGRNKQCL